MTEPKPAAAARPKRLAPRYPVHSRVRVRMLDGEVREYDALDVSQGGLFVATSNALEIFSDVEVCAPLPNGGELKAPARVVHVLSPQKAESFGVQAGMGLQFEGLSAAQLAAVDAWVANARDSDPRPRIPRLVTGADTSTASADPMLSYLLSHIDGRSTPEVLAETLALDLDTTDQMLRELLRCAVIELVPARGESLIPVAPRPAPKPAPPSAAKVPLEPATVSRLTAITKRIEADHYTVLGVASAATREELRAAFFDLSKFLHPDAYFGRALGDDLPKLERAFARLSEAYGVLSRDSSRAEYDAYLLQKRSLDTLDKQDASIANVPVRPALPAALTPPSAARARPEPRQASPAPQASIPEAKPPAAAAAGARQAQRTAALRDLRRVLRAPTPGPQQAAPTLAERCLADAEAAEREGRIDDAAKHVQLLRAMQIDDPALQARAKRVHASVMRGLALGFEKQALYEEKHQKWSQAAHSWLKVCEGRPEDPSCHRKAALTMVESRGDLHRAVELAKRAVELAPSDAQNRRALGHVYLAAGLKLNARRELEAAVGLSYSDAATERLLRQLPQAR